eukprot:gene10265-12142_t
MREYVKELYLDISVEELDLDMRESVNDLDLHRQMDPRRYEEAAAAAAAAAAKAKANLVKASAPQNKENDMKGALMASSLPNLQQEIAFAHALLVGGQATRDSQRFLLGVLTREREWVRLCMFSHQGQTLTSLREWVRLRMFSHQGQTLTREWEWPSGADPELAPSSTLPTNHTPIKAALSTPDPPAKRGARTITAWAVQGKRVDEHASVRDEGALSTEKNEQEQAPSSKKKRITPVAVGSPGSREVDTSQKDTAEPQGMQLEGTSLTPEPPKCTF